MDQKTKRILSTWGIATGIFLISALVCVAFIFAPVKVHIIDAFNQETIISNSVLTFEGARLIAKSWKKYPSYITGLVISALLSFGGASFCIFNMYRMNQE